MKASCRPKKNVDGIKSKKQRQLQSSASADVFDNADDAVAGSGDVCGGGGGDAGNYDAASLPKNTTDILMDNPKLNDAFDNSEDDDSILYKSSGSLTPPGEKHPGIYFTLHLHSFDNHFMTHTFCSSYHKISEII